MGGSYTKVANGSIACSVFVTIDTSDATGSGRVITCGANGNVFGISQKAPRKFALAGFDDGFCAIAGEMLNIIGPGDDEGLLTLGADVTAGNLLKSDASGFGIPATTNGDLIGAQAIVSGKSGEKIRVKPARFDIGANAPI